MQVALTETPASTTAAAAPKKGEFDDLLLSDESSRSQQPAPIVGGKTTGEDDDPFNAFNSSTGDAEKPPASGEVPKSTKSDDAFDSFFNERTSGSN